MVYAWARVGVALPHSSRAQYHADVRIPVAHARAGDLVFLASDTADPATIHHVARSWRRREAWRIFAGDLRHRRRPVRAALELLRLQLNPDWLDHVSTEQTARTPTRSRR
jgi:hypothetical protein